PSIFASLHAFSRTTPRIPSSATSRFVPPPSTKTGSSCSRATVIAPARSPSFATRRKKSAGPPMRSDVYGARRSPRVPNGAVVVIPLRRGETVEERAKAARRVRLENHHEPAPRARPHGRDRGADLARMMGVVVDDGHTARLAERLEPAAGPGERRERPGGLRRRRPK